MRDYQDETREGHRFQEDRTQSLSDRGRRSMQGMGRGGRDANASSRYLEDAKAGAAEHQDFKVKAQGRAGERVALRAVRDQEGASVDLNDTAAANFPIYDVVGSDTIASVKVRGLEDGDTLKESTLRQYQRDLQEAIGRGGGTVEPEVLGTTDAEFGLRKFNQAARGLHDRAAASDGSLPPPLSEGPDQAADYLREHGTLMIPQDHADQLQRYLSSRLFQDGTIDQAVCASNLGLNVDATTYQADVKKMLERIHPLPVKSPEIKKVVEMRKENI